VSEIQKRGESMKNIETLNKMIETLAKFARTGKDTEHTRRLARNLRELLWLVENRKLDESLLAPVIAKQSLQSAVESSAKLLAESEKLQLALNLSRAPRTLADEVREAEACKWQEDI